jgi:hypothetical protein
MSKDPEATLPVPARWQAAVRAAMAELARGADLAPHAMAVTRVDEDPAGGLDVWLLARGRSSRFRVLMADGQARVEPRP